MPRPKIPNQVQILNVAHGANAARSGGVYLLADSMITASLTGDDSALFSVVQLQTFDVEFDPDARPPQDVLVSALAVSGAGPIQGFQGEAILATVDFTCPVDPSKASFHATVILAGPGLPAPIPVPVVATTQAGILQPFNISTPPIFPGETEPFTFGISSTFGHDIVIVFRYDAEFEPLFSATKQFPPPVPANGTINFDVPITCSFETPIGTRSVIFQLLSADESQILGSIEFGITVTLHPAPPHIPIDPSIVWEETTDLSISMDPKVNAWNAGRLKDVLLRSDAIFVAASTGGVWGIINDPDGGAGCTTDGLDNPNFNCLAFGPDSPLQIYGGCASMLLGQRAGTGLFLRGLSEWRAVPIVDASGNPLLTDDILRIAVLPNHRALLLATLQGVFMSFIPPPGQHHTFSLALGLPAQPFSGLCVGPNESVAVSRLGPNGGIFLGTWSGTQLIFAPAQIIPDPSLNNGDIDLTQVGNTSLASCGSNPSIMYAVFATTKADPIANHIYRILRSDDGGGSWRPLRTLGERVAEGRLAPLAPDVLDPAFNDNLAGFTGFYTNCIAVGFHDSNQVGIGWANGPWLTSNASDVLSRWVLAYEEANSPHVHGDIQFILFDPADSSGNTIYVASDGGLMLTLDRAGPIGYQSHLSKHIRNLQFYPTTPGKKGTSGVVGGGGGGMSASPTTPGLIAGPSQDNGNLFCALESPDTKAWQVLEGGDGVVMRFLSNGLLLFVSPDRRARLAIWNGTNFVDATDVPVTSPFSTVLSVKGDVQPVTTPHFKLRDTGKLMFAVASTANAGGQLINVYGLFTDGTVGNAEWQLIATLPLQSGDSITSIASLRGDQVFAGTQQSRIFSFAPFQTPFELVVSPADKGMVHDIVVVRDALAFALYDGPVTQAILQSEFFNWDPLGSNENVARGLNLDGTENFTGLTIDRVTSPPTLFACTDTRVFVSRDEGDTWLLAPTQLPSRVHCTSLAIGAARPSGRYLYLSTYGRSVWQAKIG
jgi:hypothetical protein